MQLTLRVIGTMLDVPRRCCPASSWIGDVFGVLAPIDLKAEDVTTPDDQLVATYERLHAAYLTYSEFLEDRRANPGEDLASAMLTLTDEDGTPAFSTDEVLGHMVGVTAAGTDTTANLIVNMVRFFTESPDQLELVLADPAAGTTPSRRACAAPPSPTSSASAPTSRHRRDGDPGAQQHLPEPAAANADPASSPTRCASTSSARTPRTTSPSGAAATSAWAAAGAARGADRARDSLPRCPACARTSSRSSTSCRR